MNFEWDIQGKTKDGHAIVRKDFAKLESVCRSSKTAKEAATRDARITDALSLIHGTIVVRADLAGVTLRPSLYTYVKKCISLQTQRPVHTHVVNAPPWIAKAYRVVSKWLSAEDKAATTVHMDDYDLTQS